MSAMSALSQPFALARSACRWAQRPAPALLALAWVLGVALQLRQPRLWPWWVYAALAAAACLALLLRKPFAAWRRMPLWPAGLLVLAFASTGLRAVQMAEQQLAGRLEGQDIIVTGVVTGLPQWSADGARFLFTVESAELDGRSVALPRQLALGWYVPRWGRGEDGASAMDGGMPSSPKPDDGYGNGDAMPAPRCRICIYPGERWRMAVRLKQPHGNRNPFGFDYELWLWEQGTGATGYVRSSPKDAPPQRLGLQPWYSGSNGMDGVRLQVREAIFRTVAPRQTVAAGPVNAAQAASNTAVVTATPAIAVASLALDAGASQQQLSPAASAVSAANTANISQPVALEAETPGATQPTPDASQPNPAAAPAMQAPYAATPTPPTSTPAPLDAASMTAQRLAGVIAALVMGDQAVIERGDWNLFRITGVAHLMSISGLHITMLAWLAAALVGWLWRRSARWGWPLCLWLPASLAGLWGGVALAAAYAWFSGGGVPAQRTVCMLLVVAVLRQSGRQWPWHATWLLAGAAVLAWDPWALQQAGFWLSFVAVGVLFITSPRHPPVAAPGWWVRVRQVVRRFLHEQGVVLLALAPLTLLLFGQVSVVGFVANAVAVPVVTLLVTPLALLGVLWHPLWLAAAWCMQGLMALLAWLAAVPGASYSAAVSPLWAGLAGVLGGAALGMRHWPWVWRLPGLLCLLPALLWQAPRPDGGDFEVMAVDIGQGAAILVRTARHALLFDAGPQYSADSNAGQRLLVPLLGALDEKLDVIVLSHSDTDHIGGADPVLRSQPQAQVISSIAEQHALQQLHEIDHCAAGQRWQWDGVAFEVLHPLTGDYARTFKTNAMSCVLRIGNGQQTALLTGDAEAAQEAAIIARTAPDLLRADLLVAAHHGSKTSTSEAWLQAVQPRWALIQHGYRNQYQHPHPGVVQRLAAHGAKIVQTDPCGAAWWRSRTNQVVCEREAQRRYWQHNATGLVVAD